MSWNNDNIFQTLRFFCMCRGLSINHYIFTQQQFSVIEAHLTEIHRVVFFRTGREIPCLFLKIPPPTLTLLIPSCSVSLLWLFKIEFLYQTNSVYFHQQSIKTITRKKIMRMVCLRFNCVEIIGDGVGGERETFPQSREIPTYILISSTKCKYLFVFKRISFPNISMSENDYERLFFMIM